MRKFFVKLFNLIYLAGAAVAIWSLVTKPFINTKVGVSLTSDQVADRLIEIFNKSSGSEESGGTEASSYRVSYRAETSEVEEKISREDIKKAFPNGFTLEIGVTIETKEAFNFKNKELLKKSVAETIDKALTNVIGSVTDGLHNLIYTVTEKLAKEELTNQINAQIEQYFEGASPVTQEQVQAVYDNVYNAINVTGDEEAPTVESLANTIVGVADPETGEYPEGTLLNLLEEKKKETGTGLLYVVADPQPSVEEYDAGPDKYYIEVEGDDPETEAVETKYYVHTEGYLLGATYWIQKYDATNVNGEDIAEKLTEALNSIPGLVEEKRVVAHPTEKEFNATVVSSKHYYSPEGLMMQTFVPGGAYDSDRVYYTIEKTEPQPTEEEVIADIDKTPVNKHYVIKTAEGYAFPDAYAVGGEYYFVTPAGSIESDEYNLTVASTKYLIATGVETYDYAKVYDAEADYYVDEKYVNDVDTALAKLIEQMLGNSSSEPNKAHLRFDGESEGAGSKSQEELEAALKDYLYKLLPLDSIYKFTETADQYSAYVVVGIIALLAFPWALFALVTLIRTLRRKKCWTKPWIVFVFAFPQLILGIGLTYGTKYVMPLLEKIPKVGEALKQISLSIDIRTGSLIPSFIYLGFIVFTIIYAIFAHGLKVEYKLEKRAIAMERYKARR